MGNCCGRAELTPAKAAPAGAESRCIFSDLPDSAAFDSELYGATLGKDFTFEGIVAAVKVVDIYDGDTIRFVFRYRGELIQYRVRMLGYDSPEMKPLKSQANRVAEKAAAIEARDALSGLIVDKVLVAELGGFDKYGRLLATLYLTDDPKKRGGAVCVNEWMVRQGHGVPYQGGTKAPFSPREIETARPVEPHQ